MDIHRLFEQISLAGSFPAITIGFLVAFLWAPATWAAIRKSDKTHVDLLLIGVWVGFIAGPLDSIFWMIPWSLDYVGSDKAQFWFFSGVYANVPLRQAGDIICGALHVASYGLLLKSSGLLDSATPLLVKVTLISSIAGVAYVLWLSMI